MNAEKAIAQLKENNITLDDIDTDLGYAPPEIDDDDSDSKEFCSFCNDRIDANTAYYSLDLYYEFVVSREGDTVVNVENMLELYVSCNKPSCKIKFIEKMKKHGYHKKTYLDRIKRIFSIHVEEDKSLEDAILYGVRWNPRISYVSSVGEEGTTDPLFPQNPSGWPCECGIIITREVSLSASYCIFEEGNTTVFDSVSIWSLCPDCIKKRKYRKYKISDTDMYTLLDSSD